MIIKPIGQEISVTTADDVESAKLVRVYAAAISKITITSIDANNVVGDFTVPAASVTIIEKNDTDSIAGTTALLCTPIAYKN